MEAPVYFERVSLCNVLLFIKYEIFSVLQEIICYLLLFIIVVIKFFQLNFSLYLISLRCIMEIR